MAYATLDYTLDDHVALVRLNRPDALNTMILELWQDLVDVFAEIDATATVRAVVLASSGRHFTAGLDLNAFATAFTAGAATDRARIGEQFRRTVLEMQESFNVIERCRVPVLAAIQGGCIGGGVDMIAACDMRYCTTDAFFAIQEINIGMTADVGTLQRLPHVVPLGVLRELAYTGRRLNAARAREIGLVNEIYDDQAAMLDGVMATAREIAGKSPLAIQGTKEMLTYARDHTVADSLNYIATWQAGMFFSQDLAEQLAANREKRPARFDDVLPPKRLVRRR